MGKAAKNKTRTNVRKGKFNKQYDKMSPATQELIDGALKLFLNDPSHTGLRAHRLKDSKKGRHKRGSVAISVSRHVSAICVPLDDVNVWYWVGTHESYNGFTGSRRH